MSKRTELAKIVIKDDDGKIISMIVIYDKGDDDLYQIQDFVSDKIINIPFIFVDELLTIMNVIKELTQIDIEIKKYK